MNFIVLIYESFGGDGKIYGASRMGSESLWDLDPVRWNPDPRFQFRLKLDWNGMF